MTPAELLLGLVLTGTQSHYEFRAVVDEKRLEHLLLAGKQILYKSHQESDVRQALGFSPKVWQGLTSVLSKAIPVLEQQSFAWKSPPASSFNGSSSDLIAAHYLSLVKDIERLNDLCTIARNLLATTKKAQNLAAEKAFDQQILKLIDVCVRVTARGFDGETNARNEERWQKVVNLYKRLLITCLQFLHNFIMHNEHRKLVLWLDLFGSSQATETDAQLVKEGADHAATDISDAQFRQTMDIVAEARKDSAQQDPRPDAPYDIDDVHALFDLMSNTKEPDANSQEVAKALMEKIRADMMKLSDMDAEKFAKLDRDPTALSKVGAALRAALPPKDQPKDQQTVPEKILQMEQAVRNAMANVQKANEARHPLPAQWSQLPDLASYAAITASSQEITNQDLEMPKSSQSAAETLQEAKDELMTRLQEPPSHVDENGEVTYDEEPAADEVPEDDINDSAEDSLEEDEEDDEDYRNPGDQERGLLTDVPLVLGPTEIEALPMIIQAGIVDNFGSKTNAERQNVKNMQAVRCHILLAQEAGRNVLRELLIFIAAWDLPDDEFYFKMMVQIMEAILKNGLMSHAYADFGQAKDIISPAQAVVIKILTHIFRTKYSPASVQNSNEPAPVRPKMPAPLSRVDVLTVRYIFTVFRSNIVPETCALIYLQGQIKAGLALAEDFPLNLWDMERVYEGVYQFLEFFAVLTENNDWKRLLVGWEIVYDLVTLIKELDASIPKATLVQSIPPPPTQQANGQVEEAIQRSADGNTLAQPQPQPQPVAVERPYDTYPEDPVDAPLDDSQPHSPTDSATAAPVPAEEPSLFEWRNLKKLIVLVLSSLVWKSPTVQTQIRENGGVETILNCTQHDGNNPYIKEHAIMCLKFLLEENKENQGIVKDLEAQAVVESQEVRKMRGMGMDVGVENGRVRVSRTGSGMGRGIRRASEGSTPVGLRERFEGLSVGGRRELGRVLGEDVGEL